MSAGLRVMLALGAGVAWGGSDFVAGLVSRRLLAGIALVSAHR